MRALFGWGFLRASCRDRGRREGGGFGRPVEDDEGDGERSRAWGAVRATRARSFGGGRRRASGRDAVSVRSLQRVEISRFSRRLRFFGSRLGKAQSGRYPDLPARSDVDRRGISSGSMAARAAFRSAYVRFASSSTSSSLASSLSRVFSLVSFVSLAVLRNRMARSSRRSPPGCGEEPVPVAHAETGEVGHELGAGNCVPTSEARRRKPRDVAGRGFNI